MRRPRLLAGLAALAVSAGLLAGPATTAQADTSYQPSNADFADCPKLHSGTLPLLWNCISINLVEGQMKLGSLKQDLTKPVKITVAMGLKGGKLTLVEGGIKSDPISINPLPLPVDLLGITVQVQQAGQIKPAPILPKTIPLKIKLNHWLLGNNCYIGSEANPIAITPNLSNLALTSINNVPVITTTISDDAFAVPAVSTCGLLGNPAINSVVGLPSPAGANSATMKAVVRVKNYRLGQITGQYAADNNIA